MRAPRYQSILLDDAGGEYAGTGIPFVCLLRHPCDVGKLSVYGGDLRPIS